MRILQLPRTSRHIEWPEIMVLKPNEKIPIEGVPYLRADDSEADDALLFRLMVPWLVNRYPAFNWKEVYYEKTGYRFEPIELYQPLSFTVDPSMRDYSNCTTHEEETTTLEELAADTVSHVDLEVLMQLQFIPTFCEDIANAIKVNVTNNYLWNDGYNKKLGICCGNMVEQPRGKTLLIIDVSHSIPEGASAGLIQLIGTMTDITNADLIITGGCSKWFSNKEARALDPRTVRKNFPRSNESMEFLSIIEKHGSKYDTVIAFGDSDAPNYNHLDLQQPLKVKNLYSMFTGTKDRYGISYKTISGYGQWAVDSPGCKVHHSIDWIRFFN